MRISGHIDGGSWLIEAIFGETAATYWSIFVFAYYFFLGIYIYLLIYCL